MPVLSSLSQSMGINPMTLLVPGTIAASFAVSREAICHH